MAQNSGGRRGRGFTLIELLIVFAVLGAVFAVVASATSEKKESVEARRLRVEEMAARPPGTVEHRVATLYKRCGTLNGRTACEADVLRVASASGFSDEQLTRVLTYITDGPSADRQAPGNAAFGPY